MNLGWYFMVSQQTLNADSNYAYMKSVIEGLTDAAEDRGHPFVVHVMLPHNDQIRYQRDGFFERNDHVNAIPMPAPSQKTVQAKHFDAERFLKLTKSRGIGAYWNNVPEVGAELSYLVPNVWAGGDRTPGPFTLTYNHYTIHPSLPYTVDGYNDLRIKELLGNYLSDVAVVNSDHHLRMLRDNADEFGVAHWLDDIERRGALHKVPIPVYGDEIRPHVDAIVGGYEWDDYEAEFPYDRTGDPERDGPLFYYNHRLQDYKHWRDTFDLLGEVWDHTSKNFELWLSYGDGDNTTSAESEYPFIRLQRTHTHDEYFERLRTPHFNTTNTSHETFCIAMVESAMLGGIPIVPDAVTFPEIFPDDYEFMFSDPAEQRTLVENAITGGWSESYLSDVKAMLRHHFIGEYNVADVGELAYDTLHGAYMEYASEHYDMLKEPDAVAEFMRQYSGGWTPFPEFASRFHSVTGYGNQAVPSWRLAALVELFDHDARIRDGTTEIRMTTN